MKPTAPDPAQLADLFPLSDETPISYRPIIVWAINDRTDPEKSRSQLDGFAACGYGGVMIMPWGGLPNEFMDDAWLDAVSCILEHAATLGLEIWIWDDWIFGSGSAGGTLTENPAYRAKGLQKAIDLIIEAAEVLDIPVPPRTIAAATFDVDKFGCPITRAVPQKNESGDMIRFEAKVRSRLVVVCWQYISGFVHSIRSHCRFLDPAISAEDCNIFINDDRNAWSVDMLNPEATQGFLDRIHERYRARLSSHFGVTLKGFFYDEPKVSTTRPWTTDFAARFQANMGYDITDLLPEIEIEYLMDSGDHGQWLRPEAVQRARADYYDVWTSLMAESFYQPIHQWCSRYGVIATGHQLGDNSLEEMKYGGGVFFKNLSHSDLPGVDTITGQIKPGLFDDSPRYAGSIANSLGKSRAMSESFAVYGHGVTPDQMRYVCVQQILRGVNTFFVKLSNYNREQALHFHPPELSNANPMIKHYGPMFCEMISRVTRLLNGGRPDRAVALYVPLDNLYNTDLTFAAPTDEIARQLTYNQVDYDYVWDGDITGMAAAADGITAAGGRTYTHLLVPPEAIMSDAIRGQIDTLDRDRGVVQHVQADTLRDLICALRESDSFLNVVSEDVPVAMRRRTAESGETICLFLNESATAESLTLRLVRQARVHEIALDSGQMTCCAQGTAGTSLTIDFQRAQSKLLFFEPVDTLDADSDKPDAAAPQQITDWTLKLPDGDAVTIAGEFPDWQDLGYGSYTGFMSYTADFELTEDAAACTLTIGELCYAAAIHVDGQKIADTVFSPFAAELGSLDAGRHTLEIKVLNTLANAVLGDPDKVEKLRAQGAFKGTYEMFYHPLDKQKLRSGLFGPVRLCFEKVGQRMTADPKPR
tara:strand:+ start:624 stop:3242 length:2619 start_codon:yes stop_codon:yes gene_type:complete